MMRRLLSTVGLVLLFAAAHLSPAHAQVSAGLAWLESRQAANGVHRDSDLAAAVDANAEAWITAQVVSEAGRFASLGSIVRTARDDSLMSVARLAYIRLEQGESAQTQITEMLALQQADGGFPPRAGHQSEVLTTAWMLVALERAGQGAGTPAARAVGYLIGNQGTDGGWIAASGNPASVFATAIAAHALVSYRNRYELTQTLSRATGFLLGRRGADNLIGADFETALALDALLALRADRAQLNPVATALAARQQANGSFAGDAYITALALRALWRHALPPVAPSDAGLTGRVLAADTELPITGAVLTLTGATTATVVSNNTGRLQSTSLPAGSFRGVLTYAGMRSIEFDLTLVGGRILDLGDLRMTQGAGPGPDFGVVRGRVVDADTDAPLAGATVRLTSPAVTVQTDGDGRYQLLQVPVGNIELTFTATGYSTRIVPLTIAPRSVVDLTVRLAPLPPNLNGAQVRGIVTNANTGTPLTGATLAVTDGAPPVSTTSGADGRYALTVQPGAAVTITATLAGYDPVSIRVPLVADQVLEFSPRLYPEGQTPIGANRARITGVVVNQANRRPIENALVVVTDPSGQRSLRTDADGRFNVVGLDGPLTRLAISADAFEPASVLVPLLPLEVRDIGRVGLKPTTISFYLPDLAITDSSLSTTDPDRFNTSQRFDVEVVNRGTSSTTQDFVLLAFVDANGNGRRDTATEPEIGRTRVVDDLPIGAATTVGVAVNAQLTFRDAPIAFEVDAEREIPEQDEDNNFGSSLLGCRVEPALIAADTVEESWRWRGLSTNLEIRSLSQTPTVAQLSDDNGDGVINQYDIPDIIFVAGLRASIAPGQTALVAISGRDGSELWHRRDARLSHFAGTAVGDIDNDGIAEIVAVEGYRSELVAYEHDGTLKWRRGLNGPGIPTPILPPPPLVYDQIAIVNLEGDQEAEILLGREVFRGFTGEQLWEGEFDAGGTGGKPLNSAMNIAWNIASIAVDLNMDGVLEVVAGRTAYDYEGRTIWHRPDIKPVPYLDAVNRPFNASGLNAIGNFDLDDFPEVLLAIDDELYLLEHTGETIWGPKFAPDFSDMGAPAVADIDADGLAEIIVSSERRLTVFETDGTVKWTAEIFDDSGVTGATVFDFENDGLYEVVHVDEEDFRIFDALTGTRLYETRHTSPTVYEYPVVADIDGDKEAEIVLAGYEFNLVAGNTPGIRVFSARNGAWADAGSVWGSHSFHINEIEEDGTIPLLETPSWLTHNTYRVQRSPLPDPLGMPDFSVGDLRLIDQGPGRNPTVQVRVGNAGPVDAHEPPFISIWRGDPAAGGVRLTQARLDTLRPARFQVVNLGEVTLTGDGDLYAVVDQGARARECRETNNQRVIPFRATNGLGDLQLSTDRAVYAPGASVRIDARVTNIGALPAGYRVELRIRDAGGRDTATLPALDYTSIAPAASITRSSNWPTAGVLAAPYTVAATLYNSAGTVIDTATAAFRIEGANSGPAGALTLTASRATYPAGDPARLIWRAQNLSSTESIRLPEVVMTVAGPGNFQFSRTVALTDLFPAAALDGEQIVDGASAAGDYTATARLRSRLTGIEYATASATFTRLPDATGNLAGFVDVARASLPVGATQTCVFTLRNRAAVALVGANIRRRAVSLTDGSVRYERSSLVDVGAGADLVLAETFDTAGYTAVEHACVLDVERPQGWVQLDAEPFVIEGTAVPAIVVEPTSGLETSESGSAAQFTVRLTAAPTAEVRIPFEVSDASEISLPNAQVTITPATWDVTRTITVTGVDDAEVDGDQTASVRTLPAQSQDPTYAGIDAADVSVVNRDDDIVRITVSPAAIETSETGTTATITVSTNAAPTADVTIPVSASDTTEWSLAATTLTITPANWATPRTLIVTGVNDSEPDGTITGSIVLATAASTDGRFASIDPADVIARNLDDDSAAILVSPTTVTTREDGLTGSFNLRLNAAPTAPVTVPLGGVDTTEWQVLVTEIRLDAMNWQTGVDVTVNPVDDAIADGDQTAVLALGPASSADARYAGINPPDVTLVNLDDDTARILVTPTGGLIVSETGSSDTFTIALSESPNAEVRIDLASGDASEFAVAPTSVTFTPTDFGARTVTVIGVDDTLLDGNIVGAIITAPAISTDLRFDDIDPANVVVTNLDNETASVVISPTGSIETTEAGSTATITATISAEPSADVVIALTNPDATEWQLDRTELRFTPADWQTPKTVLVTGVDDSEVDGDITGTIGLGAVSSTDSRYAGINPPDVPAVNRDDDRLPAQLLLVDTDLTTSEAGDTGRITLALNRAPTGPVRLGISSSDTGEVTVGPAEVVFTAANATTPRTVSFTGIDDAIDDGDQTATITVTLLDSADPDFAGLATQTRSVINADDDTAAIGFVLDGPAQITEGESTAFRLSLASEPTAPVTLNLAAAIAAPGAPTDLDYTLLPQSVVITPASWRTPVTIRLDTRDNQRATGDRTLAVRITQVQSADAIYAALTAPAREVRVVDRGAPAVVREIPVDRGSWLLCMLILLLAWRYMRRRAMEINR